MIRRRNILAGAAALLATLPAVAVAGPLGDALRDTADSVDALEAEGCAPPPPPPSGPKKLIGFGNSVMKGVRSGVVETDTFLYKVSQARGFASYQNMGVPSDHMGGMRARLQSVLDACDGYDAHVLVGEGINSKYYNIAPATYEADFTYIVTTLLAAGVKVTVMTDWLHRNNDAINGMDPYLNAAMKVAGIPGVSAFVDLYRQVIYYGWLTGGSGTSPALAALYASSGGDTQHPSAAGHTFAKDFIMLHPKACCL